MGSANCLPYTLCYQLDESNHRHKRYTAIILLHSSCSQDIIKDIADEVTQHLAKNNSYRNSREEKFWGDSPADLVRLFMAYTLKDIQHQNWVYKTPWFDPSYASTQSLLVDNMDILKNEEVSSYHTKNILEQNNRILVEMVALAQEAISYFKQYSYHKISEEIFISKMQELEPMVTSLYAQSDDLFGINEELRPYLELCKNIFSIIHDMFYYYSAQCVRNWPKSYKDALMAVTIKRFYKEYKKVGLLGKSTSRSDIPLQVI